MALNFTSYGITLAFFLYLEFMHFLFARSKHTQRSVGVSQLQNSLLTRERGKGALEVQVGRKLLKEAEI